MPAGARVTGPFTAAFVALVVEEYELRGMNHSQFADAVPIARTSWGGIRTGDRAVDVETAHLIAACLGVSLAKLVRRAEAVRGGGDPKYTLAGKPITPKEYKQLTGVLRLLRDGRDGPIFMRI